jgi:hypothetical protein
MLYSENSFQSDVMAYLGQLRKAQLSAPFADGEGLVASTVQGGDELPPIEQCLSCIQNIGERVGLAATVWAAFAEQGFNPLGPITTPRISSVQREANGITIAFRSRPGKSYRLQVSPSLHPATWVTDGESVIATSRRKVSIRCATSPAHSSVFNKTPEGR